MLEKLPAIFTEFNLIQDDDLRTRTLNCWIDAMEQGEWEVDDLDVIPFTLLIPNCPTSFRKHVQAVTQTAIASARVLTQFYKSDYHIDMDVITSGGLLHDIGKLLEYKRNGNTFIKSEQGKLLRHPFSGAALATKNGLPDPIVHVIATHAKEGDQGYRSPEAIIVHHADFMNFEPLKL
jgi:putative nucleotidyltransferase with HDIG domain